MEIDVNKDKHFRGQKNKAKKEKDFNSHLVSEIS